MCTFSQLKRFSACHGPWFPARKSPASLLASQVGLTPRRCCLFNNCHDVYRKAPSPSLSLSFSLSFLRVGDILCNSFNAFRSEAFASDGKKVKILGWGGILDNANLTSQNISCDLLEAAMQVKSESSIYIYLPRWIGTARDARQCQKQSYVFTMKTNHLPQHVSETVEAPWY